MNCEQVKSSVPDYLANSLNQESSIAIQSHLAMCGACRQELAILESAWTRLGVLEEAHPSPQVRTRFYAMLEKQQLNLPTQSANRVTLADWVEGWWPARPRWQFAFGLLLLVVGIGLGRWSLEKPKQDGDIARLRDEVGGLRELLTLSLLQQQSASERLRGVSWSSQVTQPEETVLSALLQTLNSDSNVNVRLAALEALQKFSSVQEVRQGLLHALERQKSPLVQIMLIDWLVENKERQAINVLIRMRDEPKVQPKVRERARWGLRQLS
jgi:anti-sigma factor ChrR (cupin superfamily)